MLLGGPEMLTQLSIRPATLRVAPNLSVTMGEAPTLSLSNTMAEGPTIWRQISVKITPTASIMSPTAFIMRSIQFVMTKTAASAGPEATAVCAARLPWVRAPSSSL